MNVLVRVAGQTVVETARVAVTIATEVFLLKGQSVTSGGQLRTVTSLVA